MNKAPKVKYQEQDFVLLSDTPLPKIAEFISQYDASSQQQREANTKAKEQIALVRKYVMELESRLGSLQQFLTTRTIQKHNIENHTNYHKINSQKLELQDQLKRYDLEYSTLFTQCEELKARVADLEQKKETLNDTNRSLQTQINQNTQRWQQCDQEFKQADAEFQKCSQQYESILQQNQQSAQRIAELKESIAKSTGKLNALTRQKNEQKESLTKKIDDLTSKSDALNNEIDTLQQSKIKYEREIEEYKEKIQDLSESLNQNNEQYYQGEIDKLHLEIQNLEQNIQRADQEFNELSEKYKNNQNQVAALNTEINAIIQEKTRLQNEIKTFEERIAQSENTITSHAKTLQQHEDKYNDTLAKLQEQENELKNQLATTKTTNQEKLNQKRKELNQLNVEQRSELMKITGDYDFNITTLTTKKNDLDASLRYYASQKVQLSRQVKDLKGKVSRLTTTLELKEEEKRLAQLNGNNQQDEKHQMLYKLYETDRELQLEEERIKSKKAETLCKIFELQQLSNESLQQEQYRRKLHNILQDLRGSIRVLSRIRPLMKHDGETEYKTLRFNPAQGEIVLNLKEKDHIYKFDTILGPDSTQRDVFEEVNGIVQSAIDGYNVCLFSYGQTGSGKSWTMSGDLHDDEKKGIIPRSVDLIFEQTRELMKSAQSSGNRCEIELGVSCCQIYQEKIYDLLLEKKAKNDEDLKIINDQQNKRIVVQGLQIKPVQNHTDVYNLLELSGKNRNVASTGMNAQSSRSHFVFTLHIKILMDLTQQITTPDGQTTTKTITQNRCGTLNLCDLAGSERVSSAKTTGEQLQETKKINLSLSTLNRVFLQLSSNDKNSHISFRDSKLTDLLQYCLSGDGKTMMIVNLSPTAASAQETSGSLNLAKTVSLIQKGKSKQNVSVSDGNGGVVSTTGAHTGGGVIRKTPSVIGATSVAKRQKQQ